MKKTILEMNKENCKSHILTTKRKKLLIDMFILSEENIDAIVNEAKEAVFKELQKFKILDELDGKTRILYELTEKDLQKLKDKHIHK